MQSDNSASYLNELQINVNNAYYPQNKIGLDVSTASITKASQHEKSVLIS